MSKPQAKLSAIEQSDRTRSEQTVRDRIQSALTELAKVKKLRLWRGSRKTFKDYCFERFGFNPLQLDIEKLIRKLG